MRVRLFTFLAAFALVMGAFSWLVPTQQASAAPALKTVSASGTVIGGAKIQVKVVLTEKAPTGGTIVTLKSSRPSIVPLPASVKVPAGQTTAYVNDIATKGTQTSVVVTITGKLNGDTEAGETLIRAPYVADVYGSKSVGSGANTVNIRIAAKAGVGGMTINLKSSRPSSVLVPDTIKVPEGETVVVLPYTIQNAAKGYTFSITAEALDKGAAVVPADKVVKPIQFFITYNVAANPTPTKTATNTATRTATSTRTATPTKTIAPSTSTPTKTVAAPTNTVAPPTSTPTNTVAAPTSTSTATGPIATTVPWACGSYLNAPSADQTNTGFTSTSDILDSGAILRVTNTAGAPFDVTFYKANFNNPISFPNQTVWVFTVTTGNDWYQFQAQTNPAINVDWDVSCSLGGGDPATNTPAPTNTVAPPTSTSTVAAATSTNTVAAPTATTTSNGGSTNCQSLNNSATVGGTTYPATTVSLAAGDKIRLTNSSNAPFQILVFENGVQKGTFTNQTDFRYTVSATSSFSWYAQTTPSTSVTWKMDCGATFPATSTPTNTATAAPATSTPTATVVPLSYDCSVTFNDPQYDRTDSHFNMTGILNPGDVVRIRTTNSVPFSIDVAVNDSNYLPKGNFTDYVYTVTSAPNTWHGFVAQTLGGAAPFDISCGNGTGFPTTATPAAATSTPGATNTVVPPTATNTPVPATATNTPIEPTPTEWVFKSEGCDWANWGQVDGNYPGIQWSTGEIYAGEVFTIMAGGTPFDVSITSTVSSTIAASGVTSYDFIVPATGVYTMYLITSDTTWADWTITCQ